MDELVIIGAAWFIAWLAGSIANRLVGNITLYKEKNDRLLRDKYNQKHQELNQIYLTKDIELKREKEKIEREKRITEAFKRDSIELLQSKEPFKACSQMVADFKSMYWEDEADYCEYKRRPALRAADKIRDLNKVYKKLLAESKEATYKWIYLFSVFPELEDYFLEDEAFVNIANLRIPEDTPDSYDRTSDYLSKDEWLELSTAERNQLALDRYKSGSKSSWAAGIEYEMFVEYTLRKKGITTIGYGSKYGVEDLGRDIIAKKDNHVFIIQCKRWRNERNVHENTVCQTFGTSIEYEISNPDCIVHPVIISTVSLSPTAAKFAQKLGVESIVLEMGDYPCIKCNIGRNGEKIYHLPFDQQYYSTVIDSSKGEFYAWTVNEAEARGFRRAYRYKQHAN